VEILLSVWGEDVTAYEILKSDIEYNSDIFTGNICLSDRPLACSFFKTFARIAAKFGLR